MAFLKSQSNRGAVLVSTSGRAEAAALREAPYCPKRCEKSHWACLGSPVMRFWPDAPSLVTRDGQAVEVQQTNFAAWPSSTCFVIFLDVVLYGAISHPLPGQMVHNDTGASFFNPALSTGANVPLLPK